MQAARPYSQPSPGALFGTRARAPGTRILTLNSVSTPETAIAGWPAPLLAKASVGALSLVTANAALLLLYFVYELTLFQLVLVYWWECFWIGLFCALKLIVASLAGDPYENRWATVSKGSAVIMSILVIGFVSTSFFSLLGGVGIAILWAQDAFGAAGTDSDALDSISVIIGTSLLFLAGHGISFVVNFLVLGEYKHARVGRLVALPFKRCLAVGVMVAASFAIVLLFPLVDSTAAFAAIVIVIKLIWDVFLHYRERRRFAADTADRLGIAV